MNDFISNIGQCHWYKIFSENNTGWKSNEFLDKFLDIFEFCFTSSKIKKYISRKINLINLRWQVLQYDFETNGER